MLPSHFIGCLVCHVILPFVHTNICVHIRINTCLNILIRTRTLNLGTGHIIWANQTELDSLGYTAEEYIGHHVLEFCPGEEERLQKVFNELSNGNTIHDAPFRFVTKSGESRFLLVDSNVNWNDDGSFRHTRCFIRDDTDRMMQDSIRNALTESLVKQNKEKEVFIRTLFHEIMTPIHAISLLTNEDVKERDVQIRILNEFIEDIDLATSFNRNMVLQCKNVDLDVIATIHDIENHFESIGVVSPESKNVQIEVDIPEDTVFVLDKHFPRVLYHLYKNSLMYCPNTGNISIMISYNTASSSLSVTFSNTIDPVSDVNEANIQAHCINMCERSIGGPKAADGIGLGLYNSYNILQSMKSLLECVVDRDEMKISFKCSVHVAAKRTEATNCRPIKPESLRPSSAFRRDRSFKSILTLADQHVKNLEPLHIDNLHYDEAVKASEIAKQGSHILIVDDTLICLKVLSKLLTSLGYTVDTAINGQDAIDKLTKHVPCLYAAVFMDVRMPVMDGLEATKKLRSFDHLRDIPVVVMTAEAGEDIKLEMYAAGASDFLRKPMKRELLASKIATICPL